MWALSPGSLSVRVTNSVFHFLSPGVLTSGALLTPEGVPLPGLAGSYRCRTVRSPAHWPSSNPPVQSPYPPSTCFTGFPHSEPLSTCPRQQAPENRGQPPSACRLPPTLPHPAGRDIPSWPLLLGSGSVTNCLLDHPPGILWALRQEQQIQP